MTKALEIAKNKAICDIMAVVAEERPLSDLRERAAVICKRYYPNADEILLNTFRDFACAAQAYKLDYQVVCLEVNRYHREQKTPNPNSQDCRRPAGGNPRKPGGSVEVFCATIEVRKQTGN